MRWRISNWKQNATFQKHSQIHSKKSIRWFYSHCSTFIVQIQTSLNLETVLNDIVAVFPQWVEKLLMSTFRFERRLKAFFVNEKGTVFYGDLLFRVKCANYFQKLFILGKLDICFLIVIQNAIFTPKIRLFSHFQIRFQQKCETINIIAFCVISDPLFNSFDSMNPIHLGLNGFERATYA